MDSFDHTRPFATERNSAAAMGVLLFILAVLTPIMIWDSPLIESRLLLLWALSLVVFAIGSFFASWSAHSGNIEQYHQRVQIGSFGTTLVFGALPWLGSDLPASTPAKYLLALVVFGVTSVAAAGSAHVTSNRGAFWRLLLVILVSFSVAFLTHGELALAGLTVIWTGIVSAQSTVSYRAMLDLLELRRVSDKAARTDALTALLSRSGFFEALAQALHGTERVEPAPQSVLALVDLDDFKSINDSFGHAVGDAVLAVVAKRLQTVTPLGTQIGRIGGDEFAVLLPSQRTETKATVDEMLRSLSEPVRVDGRALFIAASAGWTQLDPQFDTAGLMAQADAALYHSKRSKVADSTGFDHRLRQQLDRSLDLRQRFRTALGNREIIFESQPLVRISDRCPVAVELLARWPQADGSSVPPEEFTRVADEAGLAVDLDRQALEAAAEILEGWESDEFLRALTVKVNISPLHLRSDQLVENVRELIPESCWNRLGLEFVESQLISAAPRNRLELQKLLDMGITLSIDDFGVGYSSLTYLRSLPISEVKIDRSFVKAIDSDPVNQALMRGIVDIASALGLPTVAEGVETEEEFATAHRLGLQVCQGFLTGRPGPLGSIRDTLYELRRQSRNAAPAS